METIQKYSISKEILIEYSKGLITDFQLSGHTDYLYGLLTLYLNNDPNFEKYCLKTNKKDYFFSLKKGLFLISKPGSGKSFIFEDLLLAITINQENQFFINNNNLYNPNFSKIINYSLTHVYNIRDEYQKNGTNKSIGKNCNIYVDDFGREPKTIKFYGSDDTIFMNEFIEERYRLFKRGFKTHGSSNYDLAQLKDYYSDATFSRMFQLFNFIIIDNKVDYRMM